MLDRERVLKERLPIMSYRSIWQEIRLHGMSAHMHAYENTLNFVLNQITSINPSKKKGGQQYFSTCTQNSKFILVSDSADYRGTQKVGQGTR